jgi:hypothetical protein
LSDRFATLKSVSTLAGMGPMRTSLVGRQADHFVDKPQIMAVTGQKLTIDTEAQHI